jgi:multiple sugar transport system substrate-binding protein
MDPEQVVDIIRTGAWLPNEEKWYTDHEYLDKWITAPNFTPEAKTVLVDYAMQGTAQWAAYGCAPWARMVKITDPAMDAVWSGKKTAAEAVAEFMPQIRPIFDSGKANE